VDLDFLLEHRSDLDPVVFRRCEYVVRENARVLLACEDLQRSDLISFGQRLFDSHAGLRDDYEVSSKELDILVDIASGLDGVLGARMMGAGFGGCSINLVEESAADQFPETIGKIYREQTGSDVKIHTTKLVGGTERLR
jgi:galactokinase